MVCMAITSTPRTMNRTVETEHAGNPLSPALQNYRPPVRSVLRPYYQTVIWALCGLVVLCSTAFAHEYPLVSSALRASVVADRSTLLIGKVSVDTADTVINAAQVETALMIAADNGTAYVTMPSFVRDSLLRKQGLGQLTLADAAKALGADAIAFVTTLRIGNLVRSELVISAGLKYDISRRGIGYDVLRNRSDSTIVSDPAVLASLQRALCNVLGDTALYSNADSVLRVRPTVLTAVGGIAFVPKEGLPVWSLYKEKIIAAYDAVQNVVHTAMNDPRTTMLDVETRDLIYSRAGYYLVENDEPASSIELRILKAYDVERIIQGRITQKSASMLELELQLFDVTPERPTMITSARVNIAEDTKEALAKAVIAATEQLLHISE